MVFAGDKIEGFFDALGWKGALNCGLGVVFASVTHGFVAGKLAAYMAEKEGKTVDEVYTKADTYASLVLGAPFAGFGVARTMGVGGDSDVLDFIGNVSGGGMLYEIGNVFEILSALIEEAT